MQMINQDQQIVTLCNEIVTKLPSEFVGLAIYNFVDKELKWKYAIGNRNDKYKRIVVRYGKGIAGQVIRSGSSIMISSFPNYIKGKPTEYPIMLAEQLVSAVAVPVFYQQSPWGVLLAGNRNEYTFSSDQLMLLKRKALEVENIINKSILDDDSHAYLR
jgi:nitrogen regulatory protein A